MKCTDRLIGIKETPLTWKERDIITAAERYMNGMLEFSAVHFSLPCFPLIEEVIAHHISQSWWCILTATHLQSVLVQVENTREDTSLIAAIRIYEQESQRLLGSIFPLKHPFWKTFYKRQESNATKALSCIDAIHYYTNCKEEIAYQLLIQSLKLILQSQFDQDCQKHIAYDNVMRLIVDLPLMEMKKWLIDNKYSPSNQL